LQNKEKRNFYNHLNSFLCASSEEKANCAPKVFTLMWLEHVQLMDDNRTRNQVLHSIARRRRDTGSPRKRWRDEGETRRFPMLWSEREDISSCTNSKRKNSWRTTETEWWRQFFHLFCMGV